jgi:hypothetical protein
MDTSDERIPCRHRRNQQRHQQTQSRRADALAATSDRCRSPMTRPDTIGSVRLFQVHYDADREVNKIVAVDPLSMNLPPTDDELAAIERQQQQQRHRQWLDDQSTHGYSLADAVRDIYQALRNFKV